MKVAIGALKGATALRDYYGHNAAVQVLTDWVLHFPDAPWKIVFDGLMATDERYRWAKAVLLSLGVI